MELQEAIRQRDEASGKVTALEESVRTLTSERDDWRTRAGRAESVLILREAKDFANAELAKNDVLPDIVKNRIADTIARNPAVNDKGELDKDKLTTQLTESIKEEIAYVAALTGSGKVRGNGGGTDPDPGADTVTAALAESFKGLGMDDKAAAAAANGRGN